MKSHPRIGFADLLGESRWFGEFVSFSLSGLFHRTLPIACRPGPGVLLIPGFLAGDVSLSPLGDRLRELGHRIIVSGISSNVDCPVHTMRRLEKVLQKANHKTHAKVALIGHSLGGIYARELACGFPNLVEQVIPLGSPVKDPLESSNPLLRPFFELWHGRCAGGLSTSSDLEQSSILHAFARLLSTPRPMAWFSGRIASNLDRKLRRSKCRPVTADFHTGKKFLK
jgi:pimeloyl-ACP methyl ester carboxylesterase